MEPTQNARGGINKTSRREEEGLVASGATGTGATFVQGSGSVAQPTSTEVPVSVLEQPPKDLGLPQVEIDPALATSAVAAAQSLSTPAEQAAAKQAEAEKTQTGSLRDLMDFVSGRGAERVTTLAEAGIPESQKQLADLTSKIKLRSEQLAQYADQTFLGEEAMRSEAAGKDITKGTFSAKARERRLQRAIEQTGKAASLRTDIATAELMQNNITAATAQIDAALEAKYSPVEEALKNEMFFLQRQWQLSDKTDQRAWEARMNVVEAQQDEIKDAKDMVLNAMPYATPEELKALNDPNLSATEQRTLAQSVVAKGLRQDRLYEIQKRNLDMSISNQQLQNLIAEGQITPALTEVAAQTMVQNESAGSVRNYLATLMGNKDIPASVRTNIGTTFDVAGTLEEWANQNPEGGFAGLGAGAGVTGAIAAPFVWALASDDFKEERTINRGTLEAVNLKVQQWASGAALTEEQTKQVNKFTPARGDSDKEIKRKMNSLYNFMLGVTETQLVTAGINQPIPKIDLFELGDLVAEMSPEQKRIMEDTLREQQVTSTPAYGTI